MAWTVRAETASDHGAIDQVHHLAFGQTGEARLVRALRVLPGFTPELSLVAEAGTLIVGHILFTPIDIRRPGRVIPALALAPMGVLPEWQRRGVGSSLVREGIERCRRLGHARIIVVGHAEYYPRFGFAPASRSGLRAPFPVPDEAFMSLALEPGGLADCAGTVEYPAVFAEFS
jgi:putative acetyltransferase